jgi:hypothetical protein
MAQGSYVLANQSRTSFRQNLNVALAAAATNNSGAAQPSPTYPHMWWPDEGTNQLWQRNAGNTAWILRGSLSLPNWGLAPLTGATFTGPVVLPAGSTVAGYAPAAATDWRNLVINGNPTINQRGYTSNQATTVANQYTLDRWRILTSGHSISYAWSGGVATVTVPSGVTFEQIVEGANVTSGTYVASWSGSASVTMGGIPVTSGVPVTLTGGLDVAIRVSNGSFSKFKLEPGSFATPFTHIPLDIELLRCQRYYRVGGGYAGSYSGSAALDVALDRVAFSPTMRASPSVALAVSSQSSNLGTPYVAGADATGFNVAGYVGTLGNLYLAYGWSASAEL